MIVGDTGGDVSEMGRWVDAVPLTGLDRRSEDERTNANAAAMGCGVWIGCGLVAGTRYQRYLHLDWVAL